MEDKATELSYLFQAAKNAIQIIKFFSFAKPKIMIGRSSNTHN